MAEIVTGSFDLSYADSCSFQSKEYFIVHSAIESCRMDSD